VTPDAPAGPVAPDAPAAPAGPVAPAGQAGPAGPEGPVLSRSRFCWNCRKPLPSRASRCPFCDETQ
jgi:hypothetical protein